MKLDELAFSGDCGRISSEIDTTLTPTHPCPQIKKHSVPLKHNTMSLQQCLTRLEEGNPCAKKCPIIQEHLAKKQKF